jgi:hypothetical protein
MATLTQIPKEAFDSGLLNPEFHEKLILGLRPIADKAGVPVSAVWSRLSQYCEQGADYDWVRDMKLTEDGGLVYAGKLQVPVEEKMRAIVGACLRNYTDARIMSVQEVLKRLKDDSLPDATVLLIPNFCLDKEDAGALAPWEAHNLMGFLIDRATAGRKTILYVASWTTLEKQYGTTMREHLDAYYAHYDKNCFTPAKIGAEV